MADQPPDMQVGRIDLGPTHPRHPTQTEQRMADGTLRFNTSSVAGGVSRIEPRFPGTLSRQEIMDLIEAQIPLWPEDVPPRHALAILWGKVRDMKEAGHG